MQYGVDWSAPRDGQWLSMIDAGDGVPLTAPCVSTTCSQFLPASPLARRWGQTAVSRSGLSLARLRLLAACGSGACLIDTLHPWWNDLSVTLADASAPALEGSGPEPSHWLRGTHSIAYSARDNSGIRRTRLEIDGGVRADDPRSCDFTYAVPCADVANAAYSLDTTKLADGAHAFDVRAFDATDSNSGTLHGRFRVDNTEPTTAAAGQGSPSGWQPGPITVTLSAADAASGMGAADDGQPVESGAYLSYTVDGGPPRKEPGDHAEVPLSGDGLHTIVLRAYDAAGNASAERAIAARIGSPGERVTGPALGFWARAANDSTFSAARTFADSCPDQAAVAPSRNAAIDQSHPGDAGATGDSLAVRAAPGAAARALVGFDLPAAARCEVAEAELRVYASTVDGSAPMQAYRVASSWDRDVTWSSRPGVAGAPAAATSAGPGWVAFDVTEQVRDQYRFGGDGFLLRYLDERLPAAATVAAAGGDPARRPLLTVRFE
jgi:hypothetical protein